MCAATMTALRPEEQKRLTVPPGTVTGSPARRATLRPVLKPCGPSGKPVPMTTSSTSLGSRCGTVSTRPAALRDAVARRLRAAGLAPDVLTCAALACGVGAGALFWLDHGWLALLALAVSGLLDALDGRVARLGPGPTPWGGVLDLTFD